MEKFLYKLDIQNFSSLELGIEELRDKEMINYSKNVPLPTFLGDELMPDVKTSSLSAELSTADYVTPVVASVTGFDTKAPLGSRDGFKVFEFEKMLIKRAKIITEKMMMELSQPRNNDEREDLLKKIFNDSYNLMVSVKAKVEAMKMEVIANGELTINENNVNIKLDYQIPADHKETLSGTSLWTNENADPIANIQAWYDKILLDTGVRVNEALTSTKVLRTLQNHPKIQLAINGESYKGRMISLSQLNDFLQEFDLPRIRTYDEMYRKELEDTNDDGSPKFETHRYFPEDKFVMYDATNGLGQGFYGPTPIENKKIRDGVLEESFGNITTLVRETDDPVVTTTKAEGLFVPILVGYNEIFQAKVI